jgi:hypothetical protein
VRTYFLVDLAAFQQGEEVVRIATEHPVEGAEGGVVVSEDVFQGGLGARDIKDDRLALVGLPAEGEAVLVGIEALLEVVGLEEAGGLRGGVGTSCNFWERTLMWLI